MCCREVFWGWNDRHEKRRTGSWEALNLPEPITDLSLLKDRGNVLPRTAALRRSRVWK